MTTANISSVAYKKGNWFRYLLWSLAAICIGLLIYTFITAMNTTISAAVPPGYRFAVSDNYNSDGKIRVTYYIYDDRVLVETESFNKESVDRATKVYDNVDTTKLSYDPEDLVEACELGSCYERPRVLNSIKKLLSGKTSREYIGF